MTRAKILMLVENNCYPSDFRVRREAEALRDAGHEVTVIAPRGEHQTGREEIDGVTVYRFPEPPGGPGALGYAVEFGYATGAMLLLSLWVALRRGVDIIHAANPPDTLFVIGAILKLFGKKFVFDQHDLAPEIYQARFARPCEDFLYKVLRLLERGSYAVADVVISTNESYKRIACERGGKLTDRIFVVRNGPPLSFQPLTPDPLLAARADFLVGYVGTIGPQDGLDYWLRAIHIIVNEFGRRNFLALVIGDGDALPRVRIQARELEIEHYLWFTGRLSEDEMRKYLSTVHVCVQPDPRNALNDRSTMNKLMEYMALGKPTVAFDLVETRFSAGDAGRFAKANDEHDFARHVVHLFDHPEERANMGDIGRKRVAEALAWEHSVPSLLRAYGEGLGVEHSIDSLTVSVPPRVSVIITCYNYACWLVECVESALQQTGVEVEVIVVNDASTDNSSELAHQLARADRRVHVIDHPVNRGHIPSVNEALREISGDYVVKLDADDMLAPGSLARATALLEANSNMGFVYGRPLHFGRQADMNMPRLQRWLRRRMYVFRDDPGAHDADLRARGKTVWAGATWIALMCARAANCISQPEVVMRTSRVRAVGPYRETLPHTSDLAMWLALASISDVGHIDGAIQGFYRVHPQSMLRTVNSGKLRDLRGRRDAFDAILCDQSLGVVDASDLLQTVRRRLAAEALDEACRAFDRGRTHSEPVEEYVAFALDTCPDARSLPSWRGLKRRRRIGARLSPWCPPFLFDAVLRRIREEIGAALWWWRGI